MSFSTPGHYLECNRVQPLSLSLLFPVQDVGRQYHFDAAQLCNEWVAYAAAHNDCELEVENIEKWENTLHVKSWQTPTSRRAVSKTTRGRGEGVKMYSQEDLGDL